LALNQSGVAGEMRPDALSPNLFAQGAIFLLRKN
jgi:hypothetical protein